MPVVQPRDWLEYYMILITKVCPSRGLRWSLTVQPARSSLIVRPTRPLVCSREPTRRSAEYTSKTWPMVWSSRSSCSREPREESQWDCALLTSGWRYRFFQLSESGIHGNSSWCTAREVVLTAASLSFPWFTSHAIFRSFSTALRERWPPGTSL